LRADSDHEIGDRAQGSGWRRSGGQAAAAHGQELLAALAADGVAVHVVEARECGGERVTEALDRLLLRAMRAAQRLSDDLVDDAQRLQIFRGELQRFRCDLFLITAAPE